MNIDLPTIAYCRWDLCDDSYRKWLAIVEVCGRQKPFRTTKLTVPESGNALSIALVSKKIQEVASEQKELEVRLQHVCFEVSLSSSKE